LKLLDLKIKERRRENIIKEKRKGKTIFKVRFLCGEHTETIKYCSRV
jgi:hypothetical protein